MAYCHIQLQAQELGKHVSRLSQLRFLDLSENWMRHGGVSAVAEGCSSIATLSYLHLGVALGAPADVVLRPIRQILGDTVHVEMSGGGECNEWVMESWQVDE